jgi:hypothetical protein
MGQQLAKWAPVVFASGCSLIYNPNNIEKPPVDATDAPMIDAEMTADARIDMAPPADANPAALMLEDATPSVIYEGQGVDNSPPALLVIKGHHFIPGATVSISPNTGLTLGTPMVAANGDYIAVPITIAVDGSQSTTTVPLTISVDENGATTQMLAGKLTLQPLPTLTGGTVTFPLAERYARIAITGAPAFSGTQGPILLRSMSSITCAALGAKGAMPASTTAAGVAGPGGCAGGGEGAAGGCAGVVGGGGAGGGGGGGGGGGYGTAGTVGGGGGLGGALGPKHGSELIISYQGTTADGADRNQSSGGGGGAAASTTLGSKGGGGGGGGGTVELTAGGDINCGAVNVSGGNGADATSTLSTAASGGGGGGAGGVIVVRTEAGTITNTTLTASGGAGGAGAGGGATGGQGGAGRIRVDTPGALPTTAPTGVLHRGLSFAAATMRVSTTDNPMVTLLGTAGDVFDMYVVDSAGVEHFGEPQNQTLDSNGMKTVTVTLLAGYNRLCATLRPGMRNKDDRFNLADTCVEIAYLP